MSIRINLYVIMANRTYGILIKDQNDSGNLSIFKNNKAKAVRFSTLNEICRVLECTSGQIIEYMEDRLCLKNF